MERASRGTSDPPVTFDETMLSRTARPEADSASGARSAGAVALITNQVCRFGVLRIPSRPCPGPRSRPRPRLRFFPRSRSRPRSLCPSDLLDLPPGIAVEELRLFPGPPPILIVEDGIQLND